MPVVVLAFFLIKMRPEARWWLSGRFFDADGETGTGIDNGAQRSSDDLWRLGGVGY